MENEKVDITKWPEGAEEVIKHMGWYPYDDTERMKMLKAYLANVIAI